MKNNTLKSIYIKNSSSTFAKTTLSLSVLSLSLALPLGVSTTASADGFASDSIAKKSYQKKTPTSPELPTTGFAPSKNTSNYTTFAASDTTRNLLSTGTRGAGAGEVINSGIQTDSYPQTSKFDADLPVIQTTHGSDHIKANALNPFPVCNALEDRRTVIYRVTDNWLPVGTISTYNNTKVSIPLTQTTARSQTISLTVNGSQTETTSVNIGGNASGGANGVTGGGSTGIAYSLARQIGGQASYSLSWDVGQQIGPYDVPAGHTGEATYGFRAVNMSGTQQFCKTNGTWSTPTPWRAFVPIKNEVRVSMYDNLVDSIDTSVPEWDFIAPTPKPATGVDMSFPWFTQSHDLKPYMTVSTAKARGFAGFTALHIKNVGYNNYYGNFPVVSFLVEVKKFRGPNGVDRRITPSWYEGAYVQDLGFDRDTSTRSFLVTLSNPINTGDDVTVASFRFADGNTKLGRLENYIKISQIGRVEGDDTYYNDTNVSSLITTKDDFGNSIVGIF